MKFSKEQLIKFNDKKNISFVMDNYDGDDFDSFLSINDINVNLVLDYYDDQCDIDLVVTYNAKLIDSNTGKEIIIKRSLETYLVVADKEYESDYNVYIFDKNTLNLENIIKEEIYYDVPLEYSNSESTFISEDEYYYNEYKKINSNDNVNQRDDVKEELEKLYKIFE